MLGGLQHCRCTSAHLELINVLLNICNPWMYIRCNWLLIWVGWVQLCIFEGTKAWFEYINDAKAHLKRRWPYLSGLTVTCHIWIEEALFVQYKLYFYCASIGFAPNKMTYLRYMYNRRQLCTQVHETNLLLHDISYALLHHLWQLMTLIIWS